MSKRRTLTSLHDLSASFSPERDKGGQHPRQKPPEKKKRPAPALDAKDEAALFLEAMSGTLKPAQQDPSVPAIPPGAGTASAAPVKCAGADDPGAVDAGNLRARRDARCELPKITALDDTGLFDRAMEGVAPVRARGRETLPPPKPVPETMADVNRMDEILSGKLEFSLEYTDEFIQGHVMGFDPLILGKLRAGAYSPEGHVDLHGQNLEQAFPTLAEFIKHAYQSGKRHVLVVTGRGKNSPGGTPVLRERVQAWFTREPFKRVVLAFCTAKPGDGGAGALYVLLRKRKKNQGKIIWDRTPSEEELLC